VNYVEAQATGVGGPGPDLRRHDKMAPARNQELHFLRRYLTGSAG